jgi:hypothetical protein
LNTTIPHAAVSTHAWSKTFDKIKSASITELDAHKRSILFTFRPETLSTIRHFSYLPSLQITITDLLPILISNPPFANMPAGGAGGGGGGGGRGAVGAGGSRVGGNAVKSSRQTAAKGVEKKVGKQPVKAIKEKVVAAKEKAKAKKAEQKASHDERKANYDNKGDDELRQERTTRQQAQGRW